MAANILREGLPLEFVHPVIRASVYAEMRPARRAARHREAASVLERNGAELEAIAPHLLASEPSGDP